MVLETERLYLRPVKISDAEDMYRYSSIREVGTDAGWRPHRSLQETKKIIRLVFKDRIGVFGIVLKENGKLIGTVGVVEDPKRENNDFLCLGYSLSPEYKGKGIMTEAARTVVKYGFDVLGAKYISAYCYPYNKASQRVLEKLGFSYECRIRMAEKRFDGEALDNLCYILDNKG